MPFYLPPSSIPSQSYALPRSSHTRSNPTIPPFNLLSWNCQGVGGSLRSSKMRHLQRLISCTKAKVIFISETKSNKFSISDLICNFHVHDSFIVPANGISGGLWLLWADNVQVAIIKSSSNFILANINLGQDFFIKLACVYGDPYHVNASNIWTEVAAFAGNDDRPLFCMGDLNEMMHANEKLGARNPNSNRISLFKAIINDCGLIDLGYNGPAYTWTNRRHASKAIFQRLDR